MKRLKKYEAPEIEITRFDIRKSIMVDVGEGGTGGDVETVSPSYESATDGGDFELPSTTSPV